MKKLQYMLLVAGLWMVGTMCVMAQVPAANIRYVRMEKSDGTGGKYTNDGRSWEHAKNNIQDAINALVAAKALPGEVWVGAGTYSPTESTESSGGSTLYMSFKIPAGITVRGGFPADGKIDGTYVTSPDQRRMITYTEVGDFAQDQTILTGDLSSQTATFVYDTIRDQFTTTFYGNSYHVVTFATNGFHPDGHAKALDTSKGEAAIECMIIEHGNAQFPATEGHPHEAYGGGIYMVKGSHVYNTCVRQCAATRAGGGIYMDGGGIADHVYVSECQALGIGTTYGYGGGICMEDGTYESSDATKGMYPTVLRRSGVTGSVARNGGGLAVYCNNTAYKNRLACSAVLVSNNVAQNEAGGVYLHQGGALSQMTITRNKCIGSGIAVNGMVNGRSGGLYIRDFANVANSVIWGNTCNNRNVQYAGSRSGNEEAKKPIMRCVMLSRADYADWSGVIKYQVNDLDTANTGSAHVHYPAFKNPTTKAGYISDIYLRSLMPIIRGGGDTLHAYSWKVAYSSALANAGVQTIDLDTAGVTPAMNESRDIMGEVFSSHPTLGGYTSTTPMVWPWDDRAQHGAMHLFVDPDADYTDNASNIGNSWDNAAHNMSDVLNLMQQTVNALNAAYTSGIDSLNPFKVYSTMKLLVHVKEGKITNNGAYSVGHVRNNTLLIPSIPEAIKEMVTIEILGGYASGLTNHDVSVRNPMKYPTVITGNIIDDYSYNVSHLVTFNDAKNVTFDGFQLRNGNASSTKQENTNTNGAAFTILNSTGVTIKNCLVAGCSAEIGAAVYADGSTVTFENCIFHNNASTQQVGLSSSKPGIIYSTGTGTQTFDHCDVLRNVGYASWLDGSNTHQVWTNTLFYGNLNQPVDDTNDAAANGTHYVMATAAFGGTTANATGSYCLFDGKSAAFTQFTDSRFDMSYVFNGGANSDYPRFINPTKNAGVSPNGDVTYYGRATSFEPHNTNPMVNAATTNGVAHTSASSSDCWGKDMSAVINRDYGGLPDIGAVENHVADKNADGENAYTDGQGFYGRTLYVRDYGNLTEGGDGSSWKNAINGNAYYHEASGIFMGGDRVKNISWTEYAPETVTNYGTPGTTIVNSTEQDPKLFLIYSTVANKYLKISPTGTFSLVAEREQAGEFIFTTPGNAIYDYNNHFYVSLDVKSSGKGGKITYSATFKTSNTPQTWNFDQSQGKIYVTNSGQTFIWNVTGSGATEPSLKWKDWNVNDTWQFTSVTHIHEGDPIVHNIDGAVGIEGLQYAVNKAAILNEGDNIRREVWVAAGTYEKDNETTAQETIKGNRHFPLDYTNWDESCFIIRDGVDVYGAFPKAGNPGKDQRQALVSTHVTSIAGYSPADYETVLQPKTQSQTAGTRHRVLGQPYKCNKKAAGYYDYKGATWDGFTLQNGFLDANGLGYVSRNGGGGAAVYYNVTLRNMVVANNKVVYYNAGSQQDFRAGGIYMDGGTLEAGYVINNTLEAWTGSSAKSKGLGAAYGGGMYIYKGTVFNSVVSHNLIYANYADGAGIFIENADFFNNTIVNNTADGSSRRCGGVAIWTSGAGSVLNVYNSIILNNTGAGGGIGTGPNLRVPSKGVMNIHNSIVDNMTNTGSGDKAIYFMDCATATMSNALFAKAGNYSDAFKNLNMRLAKGSVAINKGEVNPVINGQVYDLSTYTDMDYTERVKDCSIDVGAYEYNDAYAIAPDEATVSGQAIFYVTPFGNGVASASSPATAACAEKLQKVLDAAGRYKFNNPAKQVIVKVAKQTDKDIAPSAEYIKPTWGGSDSDISTMSSNRQYLSGLELKDAAKTSLFSQSGMTAPANAAATFKLLNPSPAVQVKAGSELTIILTLPIISATDSAKDVVANIWLDTNGDKTFDRQLALVGEAAKKNILDTVVVTIPSSARNGQTRLRIRLDSSWKIALNAADQNNRMVYDIPIEIVGSTNNNFFSYYATRSTNPADQDVRIWSILVPRGVEVWGGYSDAPMKMVDGKVVADTEHSWSNTYNGFYTPAAGGEPAVDLRDIIGNPTHFDATYTNKLERTTATTYHIVTFTDRIFDGNGNPYLAGDKDLDHDGSYNPELAYENESEYKHMSDTTVTDRAVLDGIFLTGGRADAPSSAESQLLSIHQFGGAAVVEPYAHVRNCILENNSATFGGALALKEKAIVSGCLIRDNAADKGAGIYVFEDGTQLSESGRVGRYTVHTAQGSEPKMDANMPRVILSTIVRNGAQQGGGLWFSNSEANVRVNSTVLWQNTANDQPNVSGAYSPEKPSSDQTSTIEFYPFAYTAVQNLRLSGTNNIQLAPANANGARFAKNEDIEKMATDETTFSDFGYYGLTGLSAMVRTGMSLGEYDVMRSQYGLAAADFMAIDRKVNDPNAPVRTYIEIGARAINKPFVNKQLMLRLYVAQSEDVNAEVAMAMASMAAGAGTGTKEEYYSQQGSSFAYPFQNLQDALDYIYLMRSTKEYKNDVSYIDTYHANDLPFEIMIAKGTYYPTRDLSGNYGESLANTFAIPEGVSLYGGFKVNAREGKWYGRYVQPKPYDQFVQKPTQPSTWVYSTANVDTMRVNEIELTIDEQTYTIVQASAINMAAFRSQIDVNKNNIIELWEFENQTILSGNATSAADQGVYHIVTICPDETVVGILPTISGYRDDASYTAAGGYLPKEYGQYIQFNGLTFQGGRAHTYSAELDEMAKYNYYHGGAALIDGNRYNNSYNTNQASRYATVGAYNEAKGTSYSEDEWLALKATDYKHTSRTNAVAYRDIMTTIANCRFYDNEAGYGGAISTNTELEIFNSAFESNLASYFSDKVQNAEKTETYNLTFAGQGGAVFTTYSLSAFNTLFANNEARDLNHTGLTSGTYYSYRNCKSGGSNELPGTGGAIYAGLHSTTHMFNCDVVRNMANSYPGVFTMNPNTYNGDTLVTSAAAYNQIVNTVFWGNEVNATVKSANRSNNKLFAAQLAINYGAANRNPWDSSAPLYDPFAFDKYPTSQADLDDAANETHLSAKKFSEMLYFCAYEEGRGITAKNTNDFRQVSPHFYVHPTFTFSHVPNDPLDPTGGVLPYQNNNIAISGDNDALEGPAFMRPSYSAGIAGYLEAADWSPARLNNLTDNGSGKLMQTIRDKEEGGVPKKVASFIKYASVGELPDRSLVKDPTNPWAFTTENVDDYVGDGAYTMARYLANYPYYKDYLAIGDEHYMRTSTGNEMHRISLDPNPTHDQTYVDIGVYEYIHVELEPETEDEVDILWVSNFEKPENGLPNGSSWLQPTSDLQRAIETLLASRNGHRKEIRICDGTYSPIYTINNTLSFYIDSKFLNDAALGTAGQGVKSLTIKGGYSREYNNQYDVDLYPAVIKQQTTSTPSAKYDHLIYIKDATQRYHGASYTEANGYGWWNGTEKTAVHTIPIQIDGVTLMNDQATTGIVQGAAIYYGYQYVDDHLAEGTTPASVTTGVNPAGEHTYTDLPNPAKLIISKTTVMGSGAKDKSKSVSAVYVGTAGGSTLIYNSLFHSNYGDPLVAWNAYTVNNTFALNEGAVRLGLIGGPSKMFNSVMWRNNPTTPGAATATSYGYQLEMDGLSHNAGNTGDYQHAPATADIFAYNAYTGGNTVDIDYDPSTGQAIQKNNYNVGLVNLNTDVTYGPNFNDPLNADILKRDFHISPSMRLLNKGDNDLYGDTALDNNTQVYDLAWEVTKRYDLASNKRIAAGAIDLGAYEYQYDLNRVLYVDPNKATSGDGLSWEQALGFGNIQNAIDLAGVAHSNLKKSAFVFVKAASSTNMDLHTGETLTLRDGVQVYGSVMSDYGVECPYTLPDVHSTERQFHDSILEAYVGDVLLYGRYGTISPVEGHTRIAGINTNGTAFTTTGSANLHRTLIDGFEVMPKDAAAANISAPVVNITPYQADDVLATGNVKVGLRNIAVHGYKAIGCNVAELDNAILYSTLFHHNTVPADKAVMKVGQYGYLLNATIEGKTIGADNSSLLHGGAAYSHDSAWANTAGETASHVYCSLVNFNYPGHRHEPTIKTLSGYCYALEDENLNYQLTEKSVNIDNYIGVVPTGIATQLQDYASALTPAYTAAEATRINDLISQSHLAGEIGSAKLTVSEGKLKAADRDLLGNFRWQPEFRERAHGDVRIIDRGAFETWKIEKPYSVVYPNYPYPGTCEYIMKDQALMIDPVDINGDATASAHIPGFVLLQEGASLYGNGREIEIAYAAIERSVKNGQDLMLSLPWRQNMLYNGVNPASDRNAANGVSVVSYDTNGELITTRTDAGPVYQYDPTKRADWQYRIKPSESSCWTPITSPILPACTGIYTNISLAGGDEELTLRCFGKGENMHDFIYEELVEEGHMQHTGKAVKLYPHDDVASTAGGGDFTDAKNAGWNFIGYPYLISLYHPYTKAIITPEDSVKAELNPGVADNYGVSETYAQFLASSNPYAMDRPQTMWLWYDGEKRPDGTDVDGTGGFYSVNSWLREPSAWHVADDVEPVLKVTEGFFVQTHTLQDHEDLVFYRPTYRSHYPTGRSKAPAYSPYRYYVGDGSEKEDGGQPGIVSPEQVDSMMRGYEKLIRDQHVYIVRRDASGRISEAYDLTGRAVKL